MNPIFPAPQGYNTHEWWKFRTKYEIYFHSIGNLTLGLYAEALISNQPLFSNYVSSVLTAPVFEPIPESKTLFMPEYRAYNYANLGMRVLYSFHKNVHFRLEGFVFQPFQEILENPDFTATMGTLFDTRYYMGSAALVYHSPIGPLSVSLNYYDRDVDRFSLIVDFGYILFNRRALH